MNYLGTRAYGNFLIGWHQQKCADHDALKHLLVYDCRALIGVISLDSTKPFADRLREVEADIEAVAREIEIHNDATGEDKGAVVDDDFSFIKSDHDVMAEAHRAVAKALNKANEKLSPYVRFFFHDKHIDLSFNDTVVGLRAERLPHGTTRFFQSELRDAIATSKKVVAIDEIPALVGLSANTVGAMTRGEIEPRSPTEAYTIIHKIRMAAEAGQE